MARKHVPLSPPCPLNSSSFAEVLLANIVVEFGNLRNMCKFDLISEDCNEDMASLFAGYICCLILCKIQQIYIGQNHVKYM